MTSPSTVESTLTAENTRTESNATASFGVAACFFLSGLAALLYETAWMRQLATVFGTSEPAVATVLAAYMSGLALGAALVARFLKRVRRPVVVYGLLELGVAGGALALPALLAVTRSLQISWLGGLDHLPDAGGGGAVFFVLATTFCLILIPTTFMGATLPLIARHVVKSEDQIGGRIGTLYTINTVGAVFGTIIAAFVLLPRLGLTNTVYFGVAINALVFLVAWWISRNSNDAIAVEPDAESPAPARGGQLILPLVALSGAVAFSYEVLWTRLISHLLGASVYAFATMLASFLLGISIGAAFASRHAKDRERSVVGFATAQFGTAAFSMLIFILLGALPGIARSLGVGEDAGVLTNALFTALVLLPATICLGATFPFAVRLSARDAQDAGRASARVFAWNTVGATTGALLAGFLLIPSLGYEGTIKLCVVFNFVLALGGMSLAPSSTGTAKKLRVAAALGALFAIGLFRPERPDAVLLSSPFAELDGSGTPVFCEVGSGATAIVVQQGAEYQVRANGLPQALVAPKGALPYNGRHNRWLTALPLIARPEARSLCLIGLGGGVAIEDVPATVEEIDVIELSHEIVDANRFLGDRRLADPLSDERVNLVVNDARNAFERSTKRYDIIVSQPSHPWTAGASHLYTREFLELVEEHLTDDGVFLQWVSTRSFDMDLLRTYGATLLAEFDHVRMYQSATSTPLFLASNDPLEIERAVAASGEPFASARETFGWLGLFGVEDVAASLTFDDAALRVLCGDVEPNTDDANRLALRPPSWKKREAAADVESEIGPLAWLATGDAHARFEGIHVDHVTLVRRLCALGMTDRARAVALWIDDEAERACANGWLASVTGDHELAMESFEEAFELAPDRTRLAWKHFERFLGAQESAPAEVTTAAQHFDASARAVIDVWHALVAQDWRTIEAREEDLAATHPHDPWFILACQLRALWRVNAEGDEEERRRLGEHALDIVDLAIASGPNIPLIALRIDAAHRASDPHAVLETADFLSWVLPNAMHDPSNVQLAASALGALSEIAGDDRVSNDRVKDVQFRLSALTTFASGQMPAQQGE